MKFLKSQSNNPYFNLAMEEYFLRHFDEEMLIIWQNEPTIVIGRNQNTVAEIFLQVAEEKNINIVRRETGGGAVYHDLGNINFSLIVNCNSEKPYPYEYFLNPIITVLKSYDIDVKMSGRNDLQIGDKKISGNAQTVYENRMLHHGTLLFNSDLTVMPTILNPSKSKLQTKGISSVSSRVCNISDFLNNPKSKDDFISDLKLEFLKDRNISSYVLKQKELNSIIDLQKSKYKTWDWNFGKSPKANFKKQKRFSFGDLSVNLLIENGKIIECKLYTDALLVCPMKTIESLFINQKYDIVNLKSIINNIIEKEYFSDVAENELLDAFIN